LKETIETNVFKNYNLSPSKHLFVGSFLFANSIDVRNKRYIDGLFTVRFLNNLRLLKNATFY